MHNDGTKHYQIAFFDYLVEVLIVANKHLVDPINDTQSDYHLHKKLLCQKSICAHKIESFCTHFQFDAFYITRSIHNA